MIGCNREAQKTMRISRKTAGGKTYFVVSELDPLCHKAAKDLGFVEAEDGFSRAFETDTLHIDQIFARFASSSEEMILQAAGVRQVPWDKALLSFLQRASEENVDWWLAGSGALAIRGMDLVPGVLELLTERNGEFVLEGRMPDGLLSPVKEIHG